MQVSCDVFCRVVDNFGDAAVAWRLARLLAHEHGYRVRLLIDRPDVLKGLLGLGHHVCWPVVNERVEIAPIDDCGGTNADLLVETFGCGIPPAYLARRDAHARWPVLINVEYLTAETWPDNLHGLSSPARNGLPTRHFFFPGFSNSTGGLLREKDLQERRRGVEADPGWRMRWFRDLGIDVDPAWRLVSMFCYDRAFDIDWLSKLVGQGRVPLHLILAEGVLSASVEQFCGSAKAGATYQQDDLRVSVIPFLPQREFDQLLWACDANVVRGEDSFVRAQLAARPMLWDIYAQDDAAHLVKLAAFVARYSADWPADEREDYRLLADALVQRDPVFQICFRRWCDSAPRLGSSAKKWLAALETLPELGTELAIFAGKLLK